MAHPWRAKACGRWECFCLGGENGVVRQTLQAFGKFVGAGFNQLHVAKNVDNGNAQTGFDFKKAQVALHAGDFDGINILLAHDVSLF